MTLSRHARGDRLEAWFGLALCAGVVLAWMTQLLVPDPQPARDLAPAWLPPVAASFAAGGLLPVGGPTTWPGPRQALRWIGLLLLVWTANGLPFDLLTAAGLIGRETASGAIVLATLYWPGLATRLLAAAAAVLVARRVLALPAAPATARGTGWYAYVAFVLALPYPVLRLHWALGGTLGLSRPGAAGEGWEPLLIAIPWVLAGVLSLLLVSPRGWIPRRFLVATGWLATAIVAMIGPAAIWGLISALATGDEIASGGIAGWVFALFYTSWFLWAVAAAAATRSYQARTSVSEIRVRPQPLSNGG